MNRFRASMSIGKNVGIGIFLALAGYASFIAYSKYKEKVNLREVDEKIKDRLSKITVNKGEEKEQTSMGFSINDGIDKYLLLAPFHLFRSDLINNSVDGSISHEIKLATKIDTCLIDDAYEGKPHYDKGAFGADIIPIILGNRLIPLPSVSKQLKMLNGLSLKVGEPIYLSNYPNKTGNYYFSAGKVHSIIEISEYSQVAIINSTISPGNSGSPVCIRRKDDVYLVGMIYSSGPENNQCRAIILKDFNDLFNVFTRFFIDIPPVHCEPEQYTAMRKSSGALPRKRTGSDPAFLAPPKEILHEHSETIELTEHRVELNLCLLFQTVNIPEEFNGIVVYKAFDQHQKLIVQTFPVVNGKQVDYCLPINLNPTNINLTVLSEQAMNLLGDQFNALKIKSMQMGQGLVEIVKKTNENNLLINEIIHYIAGLFDFEPPTIKIKIKLEAYEQNKHSSDIPQELGLPGRPTGGSQFSLSIHSVKLIAERAYRRLLVTERQFIYPGKLQPVLPAPHIWIQLDRVVNQGSYQETDCIKLQTTFQDNHIQYHAYPDTYLNFNRSSPLYAYHLDTLLTATEISEGIKSIGQVAAMRLTI